MQQPSQHWPGPPPTIPIVLSADERRALEHLCRVGTTQYRWPCVPGPFSWPPTAGRMMPSPDSWTVNTWVRKWRRRFAQERLAGLRDRPRSSRPRRPLSTWTDAWGVMTGVIFIAVILVFRRGIVGSLERVLRLTPPPAPASSPRIGKTASNLR